MTVVYRLTECTLREDDYCNTGLTLGIYANEEKALMERDRLRATVRNEERRLAIVVTPETLIE